MLVKHLKFHGDDITDKKIYWDTDKKQFRHKYLCEHCQTVVACYCYDDISTTVHAVDENTYICKKCAIRDAVRDGDCASLGDIIEALNDSKCQDRIDQIIDFAISQLTEAQMNQLYEDIFDGSDCNYDEGDECGV